MKQWKGKIYLITNLVNQKQYVGQTSKSIKIRFGQHCKKSIGKSAVFNAIEKYGRENFTVELLDEADDISSLNALEEFYIGKYGTLFPNGYNLTEGGKSSLRSEETKKRISLSKQGDKHPFYGKPCSSERRQNIADAVKGLNEGEKHYNSKLTANKVREIKDLLSKGKTIKEVAEQFGVKRGAITNIKLGRNWKHI